MPNERFLVTGALGCIGAWVVRNLLRDGVDVTVFDRADDPRRLRLLMDDDELARVRFVSGDVTDLAALEHVLNAHAITKIIHLAGLQVPACRADPVLGAQVNVLGTVNVFEAAARRKPRIERIVYASSAAVYDALDDPGQTPVSSEPGGRPATLYGVYKLANEGTAHVYWRDHQISSIGLRPYIVYGIGRDQGMTSVPTQAMLAAAAGRPSHIPFGGRSGYDYTDDIANTFIACARVPFRGAEAFNTRGSVADMPEIIAAIEAAAPEITGKITFADTQLPFPKEFDATPLTQLLGTLPVTPLQHAVAETVNGFRALLKAGKLQYP